MRSVQGEGWGLVFPPKDPIASAPLLLISPSSTTAHPPSIGPCFSFAYSFKSTKYLLRSNMGLRQGGVSGPSAGVEYTATTRWTQGGGGEWRIEVVDAQTSKRRWLQMAFLLPLFLPFLTLSSCLSVSGFTLCVPFFSVFPHWCPAHSGSAEIAKCSPLDPDAATQQGLEPVCVFVSMTVKVCACVCPPLCYYFTLTLHTSLAHQEV